MGSKAQVLPYTPRRKAEEDNFDPDWKAKADAKVASVLEKTNNIASDSHDIKRKFAKATNEVLTEVTVLSAFSHRSNDSSG